MHNLKVSKGADSDDVSPLFYKIAAMHCFGLYLSWLTSHWRLFPNLLEALSFSARRISILPTFSKLFESIVIAKLSSRIRTIIVPEKHRFFRRRSLLALHNEDSLEDTAEVRTEAIEQIIQVRNRAQQLATTY